ncbi:unnamed protein product [Parnassius apollo]|uniref:(apollo) hypothetical protein n=1 Tax=Parnassius apollo TaxID=110799 RepID=A0A8S3X192_PARAO|nr:unnamed protein product [Parnassius apollo]
MPFTIPAEHRSYVLQYQTNYKYVSNWKKCHKTGGEMVDGEIVYTDDLVLSTVLSFIAPFTSDCLGGLRDGEPGPTEKPRTEAETNMGILALSLTSFMTLAKPITPQNGAAYTKRWKAALAAAQIPDLVTSESWTAIMTLAGRFQQVVAIRPDLRMEIVDRVTQRELPGLPGALLAQIKLVWSYSSLKAVQYMDAFTKSHCRALEIPAVLDQALLLQSRWTKAHADDPNLQFCRVKNPSSHTELNHSNYPDLYYASIAYAKLNKLVGDNFQLSQTHTSRHSYLIDKYIKKTVAAELGEMTEDTRSKLARLGYPIAARRRPREESEDEDESEPQRRRSRRSGDPIQEEESRPSLSDQPTTLPADEQRTTTASNEQPSTSAHEDDQTQVFQSLSSAATISQQAIPSTPKIKKSACLFCDHVEKKVAGEIAKLESTKKNRFRDVAYELRNCITSLESTKLPDNLTPKDVILGECNIPEQLFNFVCDLVQGPDTRRKNSGDDLVKIKSVCSDLIYIVSKGRVKPSKHLTLGLSMKSMTSSRKVLTILNRYGHTIGYNLAEEIETEMTYSSQNENSTIPAGISRVDGRSTHVAFDNFDRFVDTATGKDTLHDTVGIIYQFRSENDDPDNMDNSDTSDSESLSAYVHEGPTEPLVRARKRRRFEAPSKEIRPFVKTPFTSMTFLPFQTITETIDACHSDKSIAIDKDLVWSRSLSQIDSVPMWLGYNCKIGIDESKIQTVEYLSPINESPTSLAVVQETLNIAKEIAKNCNQQQIIATYDLAIAKLAMQIQHTKNPEFDEIFINLGAFHTQMAFFKAIGKYIDSSGLVEILVLEAEALAGGSMNSFLIVNILIDEFREGAFGIRHTKSCLGRSPVDLTLEQAINADVGNTLTGVSHFTNSIAARERWALSHSVRTKIMSSVKAEIGLSQADDTSYTLQKNRIEKDSKTLNNIVKTMNPFSENVDKDRLFNLSTGKAASSNVTDYLLNVKSLGQEQKLKFFSECSEDSTRSVRTISRNKINNFASDCVKKSIKSTTGDKNTIIKMERDIFGRLLVIAINQKVDIGYCLSFPLAPLPPALFHCSGDNEDGQVNSE